MVREQADDVEKASMTTGSAIANYREATTIGLQHYHHRNFLKIIRDAVVNFILL